MVVIVANWLRSVPPAPRPDPPCARKALRDRWIPTCLDL
jgi:hypothetical protein